MTPPCSASSAQFGSICGGEKSSTRDRPHPSDAAGTVLQILQVPPTAQLTPASLRAGGAIAAFHQGVSIPDLLWRMRLRSQVTLEFYLQEMAGASVLPSLATRVRQRIQAGQCFYAAIERRAIHWYERAKRPEGGVEALHPESRAAAKGSSQNIGCPASKRA